MAVFLDQIATLFDGLLVVERARGRAKGKGHVPLAKLGLVGVRPLGLDGGAGVDQALHHLKRLDGLGIVKDGLGLVGVGASRATAQQPAVER